MTRQTSKRPPSLAHKPFSVPGLIKILEAEGATCHMTGRRTIIVDAEWGPGLEIRLCSTTGKPVKEAGSLSFWYVLPKDRILDAKAINSWNESGRFTRAFIDRNGETCMVYDLYASPGLLDDLPAHWSLFSCFAQTFASFATPRPIQFRKSRRSGAI